MSSTRKPRRLIATTSAATLASAGLISIAGVLPAQAVPIGPGCPALYVIGIQGTGQSSPTADPLADTGVVGALLGPVQAAAPGLVQHSYISYGAGFGGAVPGGGADPYSTSVADARAQLDAAAAEVVRTCPDTYVAGVAYSQGAQAMAGFAQDVGAGVGPIPPERIAGIALYSNPTRPSGGPTFPGRPGQITPDPAPGTNGAAAAGVQISNASAGGGGIVDSTTTYGALTGRVADICVDGDLACSAPDRAALLRVGAEIAAQANLTDPFTALGSLNGLLSSALGEAWTTVVNLDFQVGGGNVDYAPQQSLAQRLIDAADPRIPGPGPADNAAAAAKWGEITAAVANNPVALLPKIAGQLGGGWAQLMADNADLGNPALWLHYADTIARHNGYAATGQLASGIAWFIALAHDIGSRQ